MARDDHDREDLIREATALKRRIELQIPSEREPVIAGFRTQDFLSIYFGPDPAYHFDQYGRLRRAFVDGRLYRTQGTMLAQLTRVRTDVQTELYRVDLENTALHDFIGQMHQRLNGLALALAQSDVRILRQVPLEDCILPDLRTAVDRILHAEPPLAPLINGKR